MKFEPFPKFYFSSMNKMDEFSFAFKQFLKLIAQEQLYFSSMNKMDEFSFAFKQF